MFLLYLVSILIISFISNHSILTFCQEVSMRESFSCSASYICIISVGFYLWMSSSVTLCGVVNTTYCCCCLLYNYFFS